MTAATVTERTPIVGGGNRRTGSTSESNHQSHTEGGDYERPSSKMTQYRKVSMLVACSLFVVSAALQLGLVTMDGGSEKSLVTQSSKGERNIVPAFSLVQEEDVVVDDVDATAANTDAAAAADADAELVTMSFDTYQRKYGKGYASVAEMEQRSQIFDENVQKINDHNTNSPMRAQFQMGLNSFSDMATHELPTGLNNNIHPSDKITATHEWEAVVANHANNGAGAYATSSLLRGSGETEANSHRKLSGVGNGYPKHIDWRDHTTALGTPITTPVKNQGGCGSCWAFAAATVLETHLALATGVLFSLSPQAFVSCAPNPNRCGGTGGCLGSTIELAYAHAAAHGAVEEWAYGYTSSSGDSGKCTLKSSTYGNNAYVTGTNTSDLNGNKGYLQGAVAKILGFSSLPTNSYDSMMEAIQMGPVAISVGANTWGAYRGGIFDDTKLTENYDINHAVVLEGYGTDEKTGLDYWLVRNSWGIQWGERGYIRLKRVDPRSVHNPEETLCKWDITPKDGIACTGVNGTDVPPPGLACGMSGMLYGSGIPIGPQLMRG
eukprot:CAMPEP_0170805250 /NCGR_PEP_ID=MMETSP0733-20121128/31263_1 /TAXON_ID=186038 /ORGANISM="Fragilariopsis kerguelensis, Strain L26-C5" /LENGTH=549 /DNA_ID=CAMNT_0011159605 /DNA_START=85 /DNA_END=1734 /DNA_ORIENTATION=+